MSSLSGPVSRGLFPGASVHDGLYLSDGLKEKDRRQHLLIDMLPGVFSFYLTVIVSSKNFVVIWRSGSSCGILQRDASVAPVFFLLGGIMEFYTLLSSRFLTFSDSFGNR